MCDVPAGVPDLTLVVLAYDEEASVVSFLAECLEYLDELEQRSPGSRHEIVVVDDGSTDATKARAEQVASDDPRVRVVSHGSNRGMGAGIRTGFEHAAGAYVCMLPADGQISPRAIDELLVGLGVAPIVLSVYSRRPSERYRVLLSAGLRALMRAVLGISFRLEGIYLFPVALATEEIGLDSVASTTFFYSFELISLALRSGSTAHTVVIEPRPRLAGQSKVANIRRIVRVVDELIRFRYRLFVSRFEPRRGGPGD